MPDIIFAQYPGISVTRHSGGAAHWQLNIKDSWFETGDDKNCHVYAYFWRQGFPEFTAVLLEHWPDAPADGVPHAAFVNAAGQAEANFGLYASMPALDLPGPYWCKAKGESDEIHGLGLLPGNRHWQLHFSWEWVEAGTPPTPPPTGDDKALRARVTRAAQVGVDAFIADLLKDV